MTPTMPPLLQYMMEVKAILQHSNVELSSTGTPEDYVWLMQQGYSPEQAADAIIFYNRVDKDMDSVVMNQYAQTRYDIEIDREAAKIAYQDKLASLEKQLAELQKRCPHEHQREESEHYSGDYYDRASTTYITVCEDCGKELDRYTKEHSYYG